MNARENGVCSLGSAGMPQQLRSARARSRHAAVGKRQLNAQEAVAQATGTGAAGAAKRPHIVLFLMDDVGW